MQLGPWKLTLRHVVFFLGLALVPPVGLLLALATFIPITPSGLGYLVGTVIVMLGGLIILWRPRWSAGCLAVGCVAIAIVAGGRIAVGGAGTAVRIVTLPEEAATRWFDRLIDERDLVLFGQELAFMARIQLNRTEHRGLAEALTKVYDEIAAAGGTTSSPVIATSLLLQRPAAFDAVVVEPPQANPQAALIYLHGFSGNFTGQAWLAAQGAKEINALTIAPTVGFVGDWWTPPGEAIVRAVIDYARKRGVRRIYLAGLSNGGVGVCRLAPRLKAELAGIVLISGADPNATDAGLPVLALQGDHDDRMPAEETQECVFAAGNRGTYREFDGDHLVLAKRAAEVQQALGTWLREQEAAAAAR